MYNGFSDDVICIQPLSKVEPTNLPHYKTVFGNVKVR